MSNEVILWGESSEELLRDALQHSGDITCSCDSTWYRRMVSITVGVPAVYAAATLVTMFIGAQTSPSEFSSVFGDQSSVQLMVTMLPFAAGLTSFFFWVSRIMKKRAKAQCHMHNPPEIKAEMLDKAYRALPGFLKHRVEHILSITIGRGTPFMNLKNQVTSNLDKMRDLYRKISEREKKGGTEMPIWAEMRDNTSRSIAAAMPHLQQLIDYEGRVNAFGRECISYVTLHIEAALEEAFADRMLIADYNLYVAEPQPDTLRADVDAVLAGTTQRLCQLMDGFSEAVHKKAEEIGITAADQLTNTGDLDVNMAHLSAMVAEVIKVEPPKVEIPTH